VVDRLLLIANPASSQFSGGIHRTAVRTLRRRYEVEPAWPQSARHAAELAGRAVEEGVGLVAAMGGDGIVHTVAQALAETKVPLVVLPSGTTNVFARLMGIPEKAVPAARLATGNHRVVEVPLLRMVLTSDRTTLRRWAVFAAGFGFDAEVVARAEAEPYRKYRFGGVHYARTALSVALGGFRRRLPHIMVASGDRRTDGVALLAQFRPVYTYFGRFSLRLATDPPDPITLLVLERMRRRRIPAIVRRLLSGADLGAMSDFTVWQGVETAVFEADPPVLGEADGELLGPIDHGELSLQPDALRVVVPA
jgi:diacylglycerol kinase family enzyme